MKRIIALSALLALGALGMACGGSESNSAANANKATANAMNAAANQMNAAANSLQTQANTLANEAKLFAVPIGTTGGDALTFDLIDRSGPQTVKLSALRSAHEGFFPKLMGADAALA